MPHSCVTCVSHSSHDAFLYVHTRRGVFIQTWHTLIARDMPFSYVPRRIHMYPYVMWCVHSYAACLSRKWHATLICHLPSSFSVSLSPLPLFLIGKGTWSEDIHSGCRISAGLWLLWVPWCHRWYREIERERNMYVCVRGYIYVQCTYLYERQAAGCLRVYGSSESLDAPIIARDREREKYVCVRVWIYIFTMWIHIRMTSHLISSGVWLL